MHGTRLSQSLVLNDKRLSLEGTHPLFKHFILQQEWLIMQGWLRYVLLWETIHALVLHNEVSLPCELLLDHVFSDRQSDFHLFCLVSTDLVGQDSQLGFKTLQILQEKCFEMHSEHVKQLLEAFF